VLTQEEVAKIIDAAPSIRDKALIAFLAQSGQRRVIVTALKYGHIRKDLGRERFPVIVGVPAKLLDVHGVNVNKIRRPYRFAIGYDACVYIREMIEERKRCGEEITDESWLFRSYASLRGGKMPMRMRKDEPGPPLSASAIVKIVDNAAKRAGLQEKRGKISEIHPHTFRRYFNMRLQEAGIDPILRDFLLGHKLPYEGAYDKYTAEYIRREWMAHEVDKYLALRPPTKFDKIRRVLETAKAMGVDLHELFEEIRKYDNIDDLLHKLEVQLLEQTRKKLTYSGGMSTLHKQKIVCEEELEKYLSEGWTVVAVLPSGKIVIRR
jgi:integrase/recombinase XerD